MWYKFRRPRATTSHFTPTLQEPPLLWHLTALSHLKLDKVLFNMRSSMLGFFPEQTICQMATGLWTKVRGSQPEQKPLGVVMRHRGKNGDDSKADTRLILTVKHNCRLHPSWLTLIVLEGARLATKRKGISSLIQLRTLQGAIIKGMRRHAQWCNSGMCIMGLTNHFLIWFLSWFLIQSIHHSVMVFNLSKSECLLEMYLLSILSLVAVWPDKIHRVISFLMFKVFCMFQNVFFSRETSVWWWEECIFFDVCMKYSLTMLDPFDIWCN